MAIRTDIEPQREDLKYHAVKVGFMALGRALQSASHFENEVIAEASAWNEGFTFSMDVKHTGPSLVMQKQGRILKFLGNEKCSNADLIVEIQDLETAFKMITTQAGAHHVFAENKISVIGNIPDSMRLIRLIYIIEGYLFPKFLNKNILKRSPVMTLQKQFNRLHILTKGMLFGK